MGNDFASRFLNRKRKEQGQQSNGFNLIIIAPSPYERYGVDDGMGQFGLQSGEYTGNGVNGVPEPHLPTQRRMTPDGKPYVVDEAEVLVNDAQTLKDYGGPEQLDQFIQQNRPSGQQRQQQPVRMMGGGRPYRYQSGGMPGQQQQTRSPMFLERSAPDMPLPPPQPKPAPAPVQASTGQAPMAGQQRPMPVRQMPTMPMRGQMPAQPSPYSRINPIAMQQRQQIPQGQPIPQRMYGGGMPMRYCMGGVPRRFFTGGIPSNPERMYPAGTVMPPKGNPPLAPIGRFETPVDRQLNILREVQYGQMPRMLKGGPTKGKNDYEPYEPPPTTFNLTDALSNRESEYTNPFSAWDAQGSSPSTPQYEMQPIEMQMPTQQTQVAPVMPQYENVMDLTGMQMPDQTRRFGGAPIFTDTTGIEMSNLPDQTQTFGIPPTMPTAEGIKQEEGTYVYGQDGSTIGIWERDPATGQLVVNTNIGSGIPDDYPIEPDQPATQPTPPAAPGALGAPAVSQSALDQMMLDQYLTRLGRMSESERAAETQRLMQQGYSADQIQGMMAPSDVSRRSALGEATAKYGMDAAQRAETRATQQQSFEESRRRDSRDFDESIRRYGQDFDESKRRWNETFGLETANQMVKDAGSMTLESWSAKYPNMTPEDYTMAGRMSELAWRSGQTQLAGQESANLITDASFMSEETWLAAHPGMTSADYKTATTQVGDAIKNAGGYLSNAIMQKPNFDWRTDTAARTYLINAWNEQGSPGDFDTWADTYVGGLKTSAGTATINAMKQEQWYIDAPKRPDATGNERFKTADGQYTQQFYDEKLFPALSIMSTFPGVTWALDENNNLILKDTTTGTNINVTNTATGDTDTADTVQSTYDTFANAYSIDDLNLEDYTKFYNSKKRAPADEDEWYSWSLTKRTFGTDETGVDNAEYVLANQDFDISDLTDASLKKWLETHDGKLPKSESEWDNWSSTDRVYGTDNVEVQSAILSMTNAGFKDVEDAEQVKAYLEQNGGKIGNAESWALYAKANPTVSQVLTKIDESRQAGTMKENTMKENLLISERNSQSGEGTLLLKDTDYLKLLSSPDEAAKYIINGETPVTIRGAEQTFAQMYGKVIYVNEKPYLVYGYGGLANDDFDTLKLRDLSSGTNIQIDAIHVQDVDNAVDGWSVTGSNKPIFEYNSGTIGDILSKLLV